MSRPSRLLALLCFGALGVSCEGVVADPPPEELRPPPPFEPGPQQMRRLTTAQYGNLVRDLVGDIVVPTSLPPDEVEGGLRAVGATRAGVSSRGVDQYEAAAYVIAEQAMSEERRSELLPCDPTGTVDTACAERFIRRFGRKAWRRPLTTEEINRLVAVADQAALTLDDFYDGLEFAIAAILQSPDFVFRVEVGSDGRLTDWEMAERLSFFLWNTGPDEALLDAAASGTLRSDGLTVHVDRMLADPRLRQGVRAFFDEMLGLEGLNSLSKDPTVFAHVSPDVGPDAREETLRLVEYVVLDEQLDYRELITTRTTFINRKLASIYGVQAPSRDDFGRFEHPEDSLRRGLLGQLSTLALHSHPASSSATLRGAFIRRTLMCGSIPPPPANVDTSVPEPLPGQATLRARVARHLTEPSCAGCHRLMDPLGLALENFDAIGRFRTTDNDEPIDASGELNGILFDDPVDLATTIAESGEYTRCLTRTMYRYATGHEESPDEAEAILSVHDEFTESGFLVLSLMRAVALSRGLSEIGGPRVDTVEGGE